MLHHTLTSSFEAASNCNVHNAVNWDRWCRMHSVCLPLRCVKRLNGSTSCVRIDSWGTKTYCVRCGSRSVCARGNAGKFCPLNNRPVGIFLLIHQMAPRYRKSAGNQCSLRQTTLVTCWVSARLTRSVSYRSRQCKMMITIWSFLPAVSNNTTPAVSAALFE